MSHSFHLLLTFFNAFWQWSYDIVVDVDMDISSGSRKDVLIDDVLLEDVLTPDVMADLLFDDFEESSSDLPSTSSVPNRCLNKQSICFKSADDVVKSVQSDLTLTSFGETEIQKWMTAFSQKQDAASVIRLYPTCASRWQDFFVESLPPFQGPKVILDIMQKICTMKVTAQELSSGKIGQWENDTLEYLGGYCLMKAKRKFKESATILACLSGNVPHGALIPRMERKQGVLMYPSENYMFLLQHIYLKFSVEASRCPTNIDFKSTAQEVLEGQYYLRFIDQIKNMCEGEMTIEEIDSFLSYIIKLTMRMLSYSFARKLFYRIAKNIEKSRSLRSELKKQKQSIKKK